MIFNLDRYIVSTMRKRASKWSEFKMVFPRLVLAILISIVIAKPLELKIFESEIDTELVKLRQEQYKIQEDLVYARYQVILDTLLSQVSHYKLELASATEARDVLVSAAIAEADGTGGSMNKNLGPIYKTKREAADQAQRELDKLNTILQPLIATNEERILHTRDQIQSDISALDKSAMTGFASRLEGLSRAANRSDAIMLANLFIMLLFIAIETAPLFTKLIVDSGPYDLELRKHEELFELNYARIDATRRKEVKSAIEFDIATTEHKTKLAIKAENEMAEYLIKKRLSELKGSAQLSPDYLSKSTLFAQ
jgi:hypothetical protein